MSPGKDHPLHHCNAHLRLVQVFPYEYAHIDEMIQRLPALVALGFHAVWFSPLHKTGRVAVPMGDRYTGMLDGFQVQGSLYGISDHDCVDERFLNLSDVVGGLPREELKRRSDRSLRE